MGSVNLRTGTLEKRGTKFNFIGFFSTLWWLRNLATK